MRRLSLVLVAAAACGRVGFDPLGSAGDGPLGDGPGDGPLGTTPNIMFVTSTLVAPGELGGLAGADTLCNQLATTGVQNGSPNSVAGTFSCTDWTTSVGTVSVATPNAVGPRFFGDNLGSSCSTPDNRLYCLE